MNGLFSVSMLSGVLCSFLGFSAMAAVPAGFHYQGHLTDGAGAPIHCTTAEDCPSGPVDVVFRLYDEAQGGSELWEESHNQVPVVHGRLNVVLGLVTPFNPMEIGPAAWLGLTVNGGLEMGPRQPLVSVPYALRTAWAGDAASLGGLEATSYVTLDALPGLCVTEDALNGVLEQAAYLDEPSLAVYLTDNGFEAGPSFSGLWSDLQGIPDDLADGDGDVLAGLSCAAGEVARWDGLGWGCSPDNDTDTLAALGCAPGQIPRFDGQSWLCADDVDTTLTPDQVGAMAGQQGYAVVEELAIVAFSGSFHHLGAIPEGLLDGDSDTLAALPCADGQVARKTPDGWACAEDAKGVEVAPVPPPCNGAATGSVYYDTSQEKLLVCDGVKYKRIRTCVEDCPSAESIACGQTTSNDCGDPCEVVGAGLNLSQCDGATVVCGSVVFDACQNPCPQAGVALDPSACVAEAVLCGQPVADACGNSCGIAGIAHDPNQCAATNVACGQPVSDPCGNPCEVTGTGLNAAECDLAQVPCGESTEDSCGNLCPGVGQFCGNADEICAIGGCVPASHDSCSAISATAPASGAGVYTLSTADNQTFEAYCEMSVDGGGWTLVMNLNTSNGHITRLIDPIWEASSEQGAFSNRWGDDYKSLAAQVIEGTQVLLVIRDSGEQEDGAIQGWRSWNLDSTRSFNSFFTMPMGSGSANATGGCNSGYSGAGHQVTAGIQSVGEVAPYDAFTNHADEIYTNSYYGNCGETQDGFRMSSHYRWANNSNVGLGLQMDDANNSSYCLEAGAIMLKETYTDPQRQGCSGSPSLTGELTGNHSAIGSDHCTTHCSVGVSYRYEWYIR